MSGIFKNFDKLVASSLLASSKHKLLVKFPLSRFSPASYYFDPAVRNGGLSSSHSLDIFALSQCSYNLARQTNNYQ